MWSDRIPGTTAKPSGRRCLAQDQATLIDLLAYCAARTVNLVEAKHDPGPLPDVLHTVTRWEWRRVRPRTLVHDPDAKNFFLRVGRTTVINAMTGAKGIPAKRDRWQKLKDEARSRYSPERGSRAPAGCRNRFGIDAYPRLPRFSCRGEFFQTSSPDTPEGN